MKNVVAVYLGPSETVVEHRILWQGNPKHEIATAPTKATSLYYLTREEYQKAGLQACPQDRTLHDI